MFYAIVIINHIKNPIITIVVIHMQGILQFFSQVDSDSFIVIFININIYTNKYLYYFIIYFFTRANQLSLQLLFYLKN